MSNNSNRNNDDRKEKKKKQFSHKKTANADASESGKRKKPQADRTAAALEAATAAANADSKEKKAKERHKKSTTADGDAKPGNAGASPGKTTTSPITKRKGKRTTGKQPVLRVDFERFASGKCYIADWIRYNFPHGSRPITAGEIRTIGRSWRLVVCTWKVINGQIRELQFQNCIFVDNHIAHPPVDEDDDEVVFKDEDLKRIKPNRDELLLVQAADENGDVKSGKFAGMGFSLLLVSACLLRAVPRCTCVRNVTPAATAATKPAAAKPVVTATAAAAAPPVVNAAALNDDEDSFDEDPVEEDEESHESPSHDSLDSNSF